MNTFLLAAGVLLSLMAVLGLFDIVRYHLPAKLAERKDSRAEAVVHAVRGLVYALQFALLPNVRFAGWWYAAFAAIFVADVAVAMIDVAIEPRSRKSQGGLPGGEYLSHIVLSVLAGAYLTCVIVGTYAWSADATAITLSANMPVVLRVFLGSAAVGCVFITVFEVLAIVDARLGRALPIHVRVVLATSLRELWEYTQDHRRHPDWDHRFSRITMLVPPTRSSHRVPTALAPDPRPAATLRALLEWAKPVLRHARTSLAPDCSPETGTNFGSGALADDIRTGTEMLYEKSLLGLTIRGFGRYALHRPMRQSTFEFWSDDARSLIRRGTGLWRYVPRSDGRIEFRTSYTYGVRWGTLGRVIDRFVFRPLIRWETHRSFARLVRTRFPSGASAVVSSLSLKPPPLPPEPDTNGLFVPIPHVSE